MKAPRLLIVLGSPNTPEGVLSTVARERADEALRRLRRDSDTRLLLTGGFGQHFNISSEPHTFHVRRYIQHYGYTGQILECATSRNTVEDAAHLVPLLEGISRSALEIITSDYHVSRAHLIFSVFFPNDTLTVVGVPSGLGDEELGRAVEHETQALKKLWQQGGIFVEQEGVKILYPLLGGKG